MGGLPPLLAKLISQFKRDVRLCKKRNMSKKTTTVIAHRLSTLLKMDRILVFDNVVIVEEGSHDALLKQSGIYKTLWEAQISRFLPDKQSGNTEWLL